MPWLRCRSHAFEALRIPLAAVVGAMYDPLGVVDAADDVIDVLAPTRPRV